MKFKLCILFFLLLVVFITACEDFVSFPDQNSGVYYPVIEALLTDQPEVQSVRVTWSRDVEDTIAGLAIDNSVVKVISSDGDTVFFEYVNDGWYDSPVFGARSGITYSLEVTIGTETYRSSGTMDVLQDFDSVYYKYNRNPNDSDSAYYIYFDYLKPDPAQTKYYMLDLDSNGVRITQGSRLLIYEDKYMDYIRGIFVPIPLSLNDTAVLVAYSLSREMFDYYYKLGYQVFEMDLGTISYQSNLPQMFFPKAYGYFQVSAVRKRTVIIK